MNHFQSWRYRMPPMPVDEICWREKAREVLQYGSATIGNFEVIAEECFSDEDFGALAILSVKLASGEDVSRQIRALVMDVISRECKRRVEG